MKKSFFSYYLVLLLLGIFLLNPMDMFSQGPPKWAPAHGYRAKTRHVYFPEQNFYYDLQKRNYIYFRNNNWEVSVSLPSIFVGINLGSAPQVELDFAGGDPYRYNSAHVVKYKKQKKYKEKHQKEKKHKH